jgi:hypothetical protein
MFPSTSLLFYASDLQPTVNDDEAVYLRRKIFFYPGWPQNKVQEAGLP